MTFFQSSRIFNFFSPNFIHSAHKKFPSASSYFRPEIICCCLLCCNAAFFSLSRWIHYACSVSLRPIVFWRWEGGGEGVGVGGRGWIRCILIWVLRQNCECRFVLRPCWIASHLIRVAASWGQHKDAQISRSPARHHDSPRLVSSCRWKSAGGAEVFFFGFFFYQRDAFN